MNIAIVAHHSRAERAEMLASRVGGVEFMDRGNNGALAGHRRALEWAAGQDGRTIVMEDDALPVAGFSSLAAKWLAHCPNDLVSLYLGTGRPPQYQAAIRSQLATGNYVVRLPQLIHGVCYSVPTWALCDLLRVLGNGPADFAIGRAWRRVTGRDVLYPALSLVDHDDLPSVERHPDGRPRTERRKAWGLAT